ncbi:hypothetical protein AQUCO_07100014v1 [Aquilegia coerulea]|uniref:Uncharacterized protein n=1 Tax=Aquilegia coerulea TaxID=218851 RepID=A0A2G5CAQ4_AQUCA|nr:hypothetical protein AQUCO_07100014v1 [Aquilegia coerulea]
MKHPKGGVLLSRSFSSSYNHRLLVFSICRLWYQLFLILIEIGLSWRMVITANPCVLGSTNGTKGCNVNQNKRWW